MLRLWPALEKGLALDPENVELNFRKGVVMDELYDDAEVVKQMEKVLQYDPQHADAMNYIAYMWADKGENLDRALELAQKALALKPTSAYIMDTVGWVYYVKGDYYKAVEYLVGAHEMLPEDPVVGEHLGDAYVKTGEFNQALKIVSKNTQAGHREQGPAREEN